MFKYFFILIYLILFSYSHADNKDKIIENLWNTENLNFKFEQNINGKIENGNCTIQYPKKIYCKYSKNNKILRYNIYFLIKFDIYCIGSNINFKFLSNKLGSSGCGSGDAL